MTALEPAKILIVDDRRENLIALEAALERPDYQIVQALSGEEALRQLLHEQFAVILLDVAMPGLDGFQTAELIRGTERTRQIPIIFVSALLQAVEHVFRGYEVGAVDYLLKPIDVHALKAKVAVFVDLYRKGRAIARQAEALRLAAEREAEQLSALYDITFQEAPVGIGHATVDGRWLRVNVRLAEILGFPPEEAHSRPLADCVHPADKAELLEAIESVVSGRRVKHRGEYRFVHETSEETVWVVLTISILRDRQGNPVQLTIMEDVTEMKRIAASLQASEIRFARLVKSGLFGVACESSDGAVVEANDTFLGMLGYSHADLMEGRIKLDERTPREFTSADEGARQELASSGVCGTYEKEFLRKDGARVPVLVGASAGGFGRGSVWFALDVTDRARAVSELRESLRARDDFLAAATHELRTPLTPIHLQVQNLLERSQADGVEQIDARWLAQQLQPIEHATARLARLVENLLVVSRLTMGSLLLQREATELAALVKGVVDRMRFEIDRAGCRLTIHGTGGHLEGYWDRARIEEVVRQLLSNALRYGKGKPIQIEIGGDAESGSFAIRDHGIGISEEAQARLFRRFERFVPLANYGGLGLGLWLARRIVEAHGGSIRVSSRPGEGSRFYVELPRWPAHAEEARPSP